MKRKLTPAMEDYLEMIALLIREEGVARVSRIGQRLKVKSPSVNSALATLAGQGLVRHERYGYVELTDRGEELAADIQSRHDTILEFLTGILGIDEKEARGDACRIEHAIGAETFHRLTKFIRFAGTGIGEEDPRWLINFRQYLKTGERLPCRLRRGKGAKE